MQQHRSTQDASDPVLSSSTQPASTGVPDSRDPGCLVVESWPSISLGHVFSCTTLCAAKMHRPYLNVLHGIASAWHLCKTVDLYKCLADSGADRQPAEEDRSAPSYSTCYGVPTGNPCIG